MIARRSRGGYNRDSLAAAFGDKNLCKLLAHHYGSTLAVLVVTGNVSDADFQRIRRRFERIPARPAASTVRMPIATAAPTAIERVVVELEHPTALLLFPAPGEGGAADAPLDALQGASRVPALGQWAAFARSHASM